MYKYLLKVYSEGVRAVSVNFVLMVLLLTLIAIIIIIIIIIIIFRYNIFKKVRLFSPLPRTESTYFQYKYAMQFAILKHLYLNIFWFIQIFHTD